MQESIQSLPIPPPRDIPGNLHAFFLQVHNSLRPGKKSLAMHGPWAKEIATTARPWDTPTY